MNLQERVERVIPLVRQASRIALDQFGKVSSQIKYDGTLVTQVDKEIQLFLTDGLNKRFPGETVVGEEADYPKETGSLVWSIDPIDGTASYISKLPHWGVSVGLFVDGVPTLGVVNIPVLGETYWGAKGCGAYMQSSFWGRQQLKLSNQMSIDKESLCMVPSRFHKYYDFDFSGKVRSLGSTVYHVLMVARGQAVAGLMEVYQWDLAGCIPILLEAGGVVQGLDGQKPDILNMLPSKHNNIPLVVAHPCLIDNVCRSLVMKNTNKY